MPTNDRKVLIYHKRLLSLTAIKDEFLDYLQGAIDDIAAGFFAGSSGTLDQDVIGLVNGTLPGTFSIDTTLAQRVLAGQHTIDLTKITGVGITTNIPFGAVPGWLYYVGVFFAEVEVGMEVNPRTGDPEYQSLKQTFGNVDFPSNQAGAAVVDHTTYIRLYLDSITEPGHSHVGRSVRVWMVDPVSPDEAIAFYTGVVAFDGAHNYVDLAYSGAMGPLGQDTSDAPPSTVATDYRVFIEGVSWRASIDLSTIPGCAFLGTIVAGSPNVYSTVGQPILQIISLDRAYDGLPGPGAGRFIYADAGAVEVVTPAGAGDWHNAQLRLNRIGSTDYFQLCLETLTNDPSAIPMALLEIFSAALVQAVEVASVSGDTITFSRVGIDLRNSSTALNKATHVVWIATGAAAGVYTIDSLPTSSTCVVRGMQTGASPGWAPEAGVAVSFLQPRMVMANPSPCADTSALGNWRGLYVTGRDGAGNGAYFLCLDGCGKSGSLGKIRSNYFNPTTGMAEPTTMVTIDVDAHTGRGGKLSLGADYGGGKQVAFGLDFRPHVVGSGASDLYALNIKPQADYEGTRKPSTRQFGLFNDLGAEIMRWEPKGRMADCHRFVERWDYHAAGWVPARDRWYYDPVANGGTVYFNDPSLYGSGMKGHGDIVHIKTAGTGAYDGLSIQGPGLWVARATGPVHRRLHLYARARLLGGVGTNIQAGVGLFSSPSSSFAVLEINNLATANPWVMRSTISGYTNSAAAGALDLTGLFSNDLGWADFYFTLDTNANIISYWMTGMGSPSGINIRAAGLDPSDWLDCRVQPYLVIGQRDTTSSRQFECDHIEVWDELIVAGPKE